MHTNSILICFCSILYYKDLAEHIRRYRIEKSYILSKNYPIAFNFEQVSFFIKEFTGKLSDDNKIIKEEDTKIYNKKILNKWHLFVRLSLNQELIQYRSHNIKIKSRRKQLNLCCVNFK